MSQQITALQPIARYDAPQYLVQPLEDLDDEQAEIADLGSDWTILDPATGWPPYTHIIRYTDPETGISGDYLAALS